MCNYNLNTTLKLFTHLDLKMSIESCNDLSIGQIEYIMRSLYKFDNAVIDLFIGK